jgi:hypothetical protein
MNKPTALPAVYKSAVQLCTEHTLVTIANGEFMPLLYYTFSCLGVPFLLRKKEEAFTAEQNVVFRQQHLPVSPNYPACWLHPEATFSDG